MIALRMFIGLAGHFPRQSSAIQVLRSAQFVYTFVRVSDGSSKLCRYSRSPRETRIRNKMSNSTEISTYEFLNLNCAESTLTKFKDLKPSRTNTCKKICCS